MINKIIQCDIAGLKIIEPNVFIDQRGYFMEYYSAKDYEGSVGNISFVQDNESKSIRGVLRGLHFQKPPYSQAKLVRCVKGEVLDIALDIRKGSATYGQYQTVLLSDKNHNEFFIPHGFAHGFIVLSDIAIFQYKCDNYYAPQFEGGVNILDLSIGLNIEDIYKGDFILSDKDRSLPLLSDFDSPFTLGENC